MGAKKSKPKRRVRARVKSKPCIWNSQNSICSKQLALVRRNISANNNRKYRLQSSIRNIQASIGNLENVYTKKRNTRNKIAGMLQSLKSVCLNSEDNSKKSKKALMNTLSGRYLDRIKLIDSQKNVLNKQSLLLSNKSNVHQKNSEKLEELDGGLETKRRSVLLSQRGSNDNTRIIWFLKIISYIVCIVLISLIVTKL